MKPIADIDDAERWVVESALRERYGRRIEAQLAEVELKLAAGDEQLSACPTLYWEERGAAFVLAKTGEGRYRTMFFYQDEPAGEQYGTGRREYDDLLDCVTAVLRLQADHEKQRLGVGSGDTAVDLEEADEQA
jgi:hypothetical protein